MPRTFGEIPGQPEGSWYRSRQDAHDAGVHRPLQAGISGAAAEGADSIVVSGGYGDDRDYGDTIVYTGHGGNDPTTGVQVADQVLERGNAALALNHDRGLPLRVIRGAGGDPVYTASQAPDGRSSPRLSRHVLGERRRRADRRPGQSGELPMTCAR